MFLVDLCYFMFFPYGVNIRSWSFRNSQTSEIQNALNDFRQTSLPAYIAVVGVVLWQYHLLIVQLLDSRERGNGENALYIFVKLIISIVLTGRSSSALFLLLLSLSYLSLLNVIVQIFSNLFPCFSASSWT